MIRKRRTGARVSGVLGIATLMAVAASWPALAQAGPRKAAGKKQSASRSVSAQATAGSQVGKTQTPSAQQMRAELTVMLQRDVEDLNSVTLPDGTTMIDLDGGFQNMIVATFDANGDLVLTCADNVAAVEALLESRSVPNINARGQKKESGRKTVSKRAPVPAEEK
jgi:hypothetical protein